MSATIERPKSQWVWYEDRVVVNDFDELGRVICTTIMPMDSGQLAVHTRFLSSSSSSSCSWGEAIHRVYSNIVRTLPFSGDGLRYSLARVSTESGAVVAECVPIRTQEDGRTPTADETEEWETDDGVPHMVRWLSESRIWPQKIVVRFFDGENLLDVQTVSQANEDTEHEPESRRCEGDRETQE